MSDLSVLIIDDEERLRELLSRSVERMGFEVNTVSTAEQAGIELRTRSYDVVVLDLNLPGKSGLDFMDDLRRQWPQVQVIVLTGFGDVKSAQKAVRHKLADYITKPFDLGEIERALDRARRQIQSTSGPAAPKAADAACASMGTLAAMERQMILDALERHEGNRTAAAEELGITRRTLYNKIEQYRLRDLL